MKSLFCRLKKYSYIEYSWFANIWNNLETIFYCSLQNKKFYALLSPTCAKLALPIQNYFKTDSCQLDEGLKMGVQSCGCSANS